MKPKLELKNKIKIVALTLGLMLPFLTQAQESGLGNWMIYIGNKKINKSWNLHHEVQYRNYNALGDLEMLLLRAGLGYTFNEAKINFLIGYGYILSKNYLLDSDDKISINEHRIFQQLTSKQNIGIVQVNHRYRFEQRFVEEDYKMRFRYFLGLNIPFKNTEGVKEKFYLSAYNEIFLNTESSIFDRNRVYGVLGYHLNKNIRLELGYMNQFFETRSRDQINIVTFVNF
ncbi:uncharacterized protein DUF2490 [Gillisia mitskevichiae]|uniref:Uncharacterized protein DUF2490 n=1 Tax=Gillisia mitskevichiae TaxID=270921 RepID=A0A495NYF5_9FLAO|nr:DUF2490 domain-containing protein [Gillisia mitskevichiae]RKS42795.1 uncharacterized protein DUF2490 [Gillisia mitskevichiae]